MMVRIANSLILSVAMLLVATSASALEPVTLQLKWSHAFQFAGYYAAKEQGYYREAGLDVNIVEAVADTDPVRNVLEGKAQFGVGTSNLLLERAAGKPVVALAVVFQQSPYEIYAAPNIHNLRDLIGKRIMLEPQSGELLAYLMKEGIPLDSIRQIPHSFDATGLMQGKAEAISGYIPNEPFFFRQAHYPYQTFSPRSAGIDFYGDNLFTSEQEIQAHPKRVKDFRAATLRGWQYAREHRDEVIALILAKYPSQHTREYLRFESDHMIPLLQPNLIEIGYMNPNRWRDIAGTYADIGLLPRDFSLEGFLYDASEPDLTWFYRSLLIAMMLIAGIGAVALYVMRTNRKLQCTLVDLGTAQQALGDSEKHYRLLVETMRDVVWILDPVSLRFRYVSPSAQQLRGYTPEEIMARPMDDALLPEYAASLKEKIKRNTAEFLSGKNSSQVFREEVEQPCKDGSTVWTEVIAKYYLNEETGQAEIHGVTRDITERKLAEEKIRHLAFYDALTGLPNRRMLNDRLIQALAISKRSGLHGALMFIDLDNFKPLNDRHGHAVGDLLLVEAARRLSHYVREVDTVARFGGDEFVVILGALSEDKETSKAQASIVAKKIHSILAEPYFLEWHQEEEPETMIEHHCTSSIGVTLFAGHETSPDEILKWADAAMYQAKEDGRNLIRFYGPQV
jgi:diguanylate cyclase (GGDEF)-like protein/PAS domain S-box-containing protein